MRFVPDTHPHILGKLAAHLRMLGFDSLYRNDCPHEELAHVAAHCLRGRANRPMTPSLYCAAREKSLPRC